MVVEWERLHLQQGKYELYRSHPSYGKCTHTQWFSTCDVKPLCFQSRLLCCSLCFFVFFFGFWKSYFSFQLFGFSDLWIFVLIVKSKWMIIHCQNSPNNSIFLFIHFILQQLWRMIISLVWVTDCNIYYTLIQFEEAVFERQIWKKRKYCGSFYYIWKHTCGSTQTTAPFKKRFTAHDYDCK